MENIHASYVAKRVGIAMRKRRKLLGLTPEDVVKSINTDPRYVKAGLKDITVRQIRHYEDATRKIPSDVLYWIACVLNVEVTYFYFTLPSTVLDNDGKRSVKGNPLHWTL